jgi:hypothetical protein
MMLLAPAFKASLRLMVVGGFLLWVNHLYGQQLIELLLPILRKEIGWLDDNYRILDLTLATLATDSVIRLDVTLARYVFVGAHHGIAPDPRGHAVITTLAQSLLQPMIIGLTLLAVWPVSRMTQYLWRYLIGLPLLLLMLPLDIPFVLLGEVWEIIILSQVQHDFSPLLAWKDFLQQGGRQGLALCTAVVAIVIAQWLAPQRPNLRETTR